MIEQDPGRLTNEALKQAAILSVENFPSASEDKDVQEALSSQWGNRRIILLPLSSGNLAVFNGAGELCGFLEGYHMISSILEVWRPVEQDPGAELLEPGLLEELGL